MRLIGTEAGRVVQVVHADEVRPSQGFDLPRLVHIVSNKYGFSTTPTDYAGFTQPNGLRFERGRFGTPADDVVAILDLSLFNDGIIAGCADTEIADRVVNDVIELLVGSGMIRRPAMLRPRTYTSHVVVEFDRLKDGVLERLFNTGHRLRAALREQYGWDNDTGLHRIAFSTDPSEIPHYRNTLFAIERRPTIPYREKWFWSVAPLPLFRHLKLLEETEQDLAST
jgi:hypothetical protein